MKRLFALFLVLLAAWGCSKRENPVEPTIQSGTMITGSLVSVILDSVIVPQNAGRRLLVYEPVGYSTAETTVYLPDSTVDPPAIDTFSYVTSHDYPVLYLLHGYGFDYAYFKTLFAVKDILDEMIASGEIIPMVVVMPDGNNTFGGSFYANSPRDTANGVSFSGLYEDYFLNELMQYVELHFNTDTTQAGRGISGHSMGGYGAYRLAMRHPDLFSSVSALSAPLAFSGLTALLPAVYAENGWTPGDTAGFYAIAPSSNKRVTSMMFAMGSAFSPHGISDSDTSLFHRVLVTTLRIGVDLPFKVDGVLDSNFWTTEWLVNDPVTMLSNGGAAALAGKALYLDCGDNDDLYLHLQNRGFSQALEAASLTHTYHEYAGYPGSPADHMIFVADRLREMLKFHSQAFAANR